MCFRYSVITSFIPLLFRNTSLHMCSVHDISSMNLSKTLCVATSLYSSFFVIVHFLLAYYIAGKTVLWKRLARRILLSVALILFSARFPHPCLGTYSLSVPRRRILSPPRFHLFLPLCSPVVHLFKKDWIYTHKKKKWKSVEMNQMIIFA